MPALQQNTAPTEFVVIRHGESVMNSQRLIQGQIPSELSGRGLREAAALGERFSDERFDICYCSDLRRAVQTAEPTLKITGTPVQYLPQLRERHFGVLQGQNVGELDGHPEFDGIYARFLSRDPDYVIPGGESANQLYARTVQFFEQAARDHAGQRMLIVTHGGSLDAILRHILALPYQRPRPYKLHNAAVNIFHHELNSENGAWTIVTLGDLSHLRHLDGTAT